MASRMVLRKMSAGPLAANKIAEKRGQEVLIWRNSEE